MAHRDAAKHYLVGAILAQVLIMLCSLPGRSTVLIPLVNATSCKAPFCTLCREANERMVVTLDLRRECTSFRHQWPKRWKANTHYSNRKLYLQPISAFYIEVCGSLVIAIFLLRSSVNNTRDAESVYESHSDNANDSHTCYVSNVCLGQEDDLQAA